MKRTGNLYNLIADTDNLLLAYWKAKRGKEAKKEVIEFSKHLNQNIFLLKDDLLKQTLLVGNYHYFTIYDPKERVICAASFPERVLHHAIMNICHPVFEKFQIFDSYATRVGKGQFAALDRSMIFTKQNEWFCKLDVRKYFDSISHEILLQKLNDKFKDKALLQLFGQIINSYEVKPSIGLPIGNLTSQYFANFYLSFADHYIKEQLNVKAYMRYMDDMVLWGNNKQQLLQVMQRFIYYLKNHLGLEVKEPCIHKTKQGLPFLGFVMYPFGIRLNKRSKQRLFSKFNQYCIKNEHNEWSQKEYANHILPLIAFVQYANTKGLCDKLLVKWKYAYGLEPCESRRQLEQQSRVLSCCQSEQQHPRQPQQQYRVSPLPCPLAQ